MIGLSVVSDHAVLWQHTKSVLIWGKTGHTVLWQHAKSVLWRGQTNQHLLQSISSDWSTQSAKPSQTSELLTHWWSNKHVNCEPLSHFPEGTGLQTWHTTQKQMADRPQDCPIRDFVQQVKLSLLNKRQFCFWDWKLSKFYFKRLRNSRDLSLSPRESPVAR